MQSIVLYYGEDVFSLGSLDIMAVLLEATLIAPAASYVAVRILVPRFGPSKTFGRVSGRISILILGYCHHLLLNFLNLNLILILGPHPNPRQGPYSERATNHCATIHLSFREVLSNAMGTSRG